MTELVERFLPSKEEFDDFFACHQEWVQNCLSDGDHNSWMPHLAVLAKSHPDADSGVILHALMVDFNESHEKQNTLLGLGVRCYEQREIPMAVVLSSEAWLAEDDGSGTEPRHRADRREVIMLAGVSLGHKHLAHASMPVTRTGENKISPGAFGPISTKGEMPLLDWFYRGFFLRCQTDRAGEGS